MKKTIITVSLCIITSNLFAQTERNPDLKPNQQSDQRVKTDNDKDFEQWMKENKVPNVGLGIIRNGKIEKIKVYGALRDGNAAPDNTLFNVASLTKPVTAIVALKLISAGKWNLDEPLDKYWTDPDIAQDPRNKKLTTRIILSHQTGFPNWRWMNADGKLNFQFDPGTKYQYSGEGFEYLRRALEKKFNKTLNQLAEELIFQPLKMKDTSYIWNEKKDALRFSEGYDKDENMYPTVKSTTSNAADDLMTTVSDYSRFLISVINGDGLSKKVVEDMKTGQVITKKGKAFGLGFEIYNLGDGNIALSHGGSDKGVQTIFFIIPKTKDGIVIFTNVDDGYKSFEKLLTEYLGEYGKKVVEIETK
ncbi:beta-lactamase family protein [Chryseobacterium sp. RP-3-3]|uniref:Beta-lactamase family protein n=1 Tax=Chryseobacterium antibioticum TaxID=2728847 RepID=A0A7Y0FS66_9FLAO|nr:serine hydrolase domain-containing protein [Chryseobacterium antibioticum]NML70124.1 beta-lactamase family protein [Chryseobacterium antibioticum]